MARRLLPEMLANLRGIADFIGDRQHLVVAHIVGGMAVNYWTAYRMSVDSDITWSHRVLLPPELQSFVVQDEEGLPQVVNIDSSFMDAIGLFHPDWKDDCEEVTRIRSLVVKVISPTDLAVSKIGRFADRDREDICTLARQRLIEVERVRCRAREALDYFIGDPIWVRHNLTDALELIRTCRDDDLEP